MEESAKRCLYEILNVARDASQEEIRSSYRRLALQLHPDKNPNSSPAAFQELQSAYEVLSDPKERQFYDSHRSQILFSNPNPNASKSVFDLDLVSYFSPSAFSGYGDTGKGFFKVYGDVFGKIYAQELYFVKELGLDHDLVRPAPLIGNLESEYSQVTAFYGYWLGFVTVLDFGWMDEYDVSLGVNRRSRRMMEEENKKKRKKAKREYVDLVRDLVAFVKKRDKRVRDMQLKKSLEEEKRREEEKNRKKEEERRKIEKARMYKEPEWAKIDEDEMGFVVDDDVSDGDDRGKKKEFYCVVCNKKFKSDKQWKNHEQSKKHREKVTELRVLFQEEDEDEEEVNFQSLDDGEIEKMEDDNVVDGLSEEINEELRLKDEEVVEDADLEKDDEVICSEDDEASILETMVSGRNSRKNSFMSLDDSLTDQGNLRNNHEESFVEHDSRKGRRNRASRRGTDADVECEILREETSVNRESEFEVQNQERNVGRTKDGQIQSEGENAKETKEDPLRSYDKAKDKGNQGAGKKHKKQPVDARGPTRKDTNISRAKGTKQKGSAKASGNSCDTCGESFDTRNKLFAHLGATGHAVLKSR